MRFLALLLLASAPAFAKFEVPGFELVYTAPVETKLENPDLRSPADVWVEMIDAAKSRLDFEQMYAVSKPGEPLDRVIEAMEKAGERGVKIRMLLEQKMLRASDPATIERLRKIKNMELRIWEFGKLGTDGIVHAKYFLKDNNEAYLGSQNFDWRSLKHIHETGVRITDKKIVRQMQEIFDLDWKYAGSILAGKKAHAGVASHGAKPSDGSRDYLVASPLGLLPSNVVYSQDELLNLLSRAKEEVRVQLLDYSAAYRDKSYYGVIDSALRAAAARGVKVKLLVSHWSTEKPAIDYLKSLAMIPNVEIRIATIPTAKEGKIPFARVNHSKIMAIDHVIGWVGTSNWSGGYLDKLRNLEVVIKDAKFAQRLADLHEQLWSSEYSQKIDVTKDYPKVEKGEGK